MDKRFEYQVCYCLIDRVTFVNGRWLGADIPESQRKQEDVLSCPLIWEYLQNAGAVGWELVSVIDSPYAIGKGDQRLRNYFLKRELTEMA
ncbi:MAG: hypothetical protein HY000_36200 [Planctomycetes bacterium]|nr:hypothetical protein [Planctomycetota bacterium]